MKKKNILMIGMPASGKFHIGDYAQYDFNVTPEMAEETKKWIADKGYPKPETDITELSE